MSGPLSGIEHVKNTKQYVARNAASLIKDAERARQVASEKSNQKDMKSNSYISPLPST